MGSLSWLQVLQTLAKLYKKNIYIYHIHHICTEYINTILSFWPLFHKSSMNFYSVNYTILQYKIHKFVNLSDFFVNNQNHHQIMIDNKTLCLVVYLFKKKVAPDTSRPMTQTARHSKQCKGCGKA